MLSHFIFQFAILLLGAAYALCGKYGKRETEARSEADPELGYLSRGYEGFGGIVRSRRSPIKPGVGWRRACGGWGYGRADKYNIFAWLTLSQLELAHVKLQS